MSKRVYEIARELDLESKEVISRLREAGVEVKSHSSSVEDPIYERVFGDGQNGQADASKDVTTDEDPTDAAETTSVEPAGGTTAEDAQNGRPEASPVSAPAAPAAFVVAQP